MVVSNSWHELLTSESFKRIGKSVFQDDIERELLQASRVGNIKEVENMLAIGMVDVNSIGGFSDATPLFYATSAGHKGVVQILLDAGADPNKANKKEFTPLHYARGQRDVVQLLLDRGVGPNQAWMDGRTTLHYAAYEGHKDVVQLLLDRGADPNNAARNGWTPLHDASYGGRKELVQILLSRDADASNILVDERTPLHLALQKGHTDVVNILQGGGV